MLMLKEQDETLSFRRSCREGVCGSDGMNINGVNGLACITPLASLKQPVQIRPLPGMPVVRDLVVDLSQFYQHYRYARGLQLQLKQGQWFGDSYDAVVGAEVAAALGYTPGDSIIIAHGSGDKSFITHKDKRFELPVY